MNSLNNNNVRKFMCNSLILTASAIFMRTVGVAYNIYLSNIVGAEVMGLHSLVINVFGFALTLATSGINLASSKCVAEARGNESEIKAIMKRCIIYSIAFGSITSLGLYLLSSIIAIQWINDPRVILPLKIISFSLPAISVSSTLSGYFSAIRRVWKTAATQIAEQAIKIIFTSALLIPLFPMGTEYACIAIILGSTISEIASFAFYYILYKIDKKDFCDRKENYTPNLNSLTKKILSIALPTAFSAYIRSGLTTVEHILIPYGLREFGLNQSQALEQYGMISGMVLPIVLFPYAFIHSFTSLLIPEISEAKSIGENKHIAYITTRAWRLTIIFGLCGAGILSVGSYELGVILYNSKQVGHYILCIAPLMALMYLDTVTDSILKGIGEHVYTMNINIADAVISVILVLLLVPQYGVYGYIAVLYLAELLNFSLSAYRLISKCRFKFKLFKWFLLPLMCVIIVSRIFVTIINYIELEKSTYVTLIIHILMILLAYLISLTITGCLDKEIRNWFAASIGLKRS